MWRVMQEVFCCLATAFGRDNKKLGTCEIHIRNMFLTLAAGIVVRILHRLQILLTFIDVV